MILCLKTKAKEAPQELSLKLKYRLPPVVAVPCHLACRLQVQDHRTYYLLKLAAQGCIDVTCLRCLETFSYDYNHETELAVCSDENKAKDLQEQYDVLVAPQFKVDLTEILIDDLHLFLPEKHPNPEDCNAEVYQYVSQLPKG